MESLKTRRNALSVETPAPPPAWALLERELIRAQTLACQEFFDRYFDERGYLMCVPRWGGDTSFMPVLADVKVLPEHLVETRERLRAAWTGS